LILFKYINNIDKTQIDFKYKLLKNYKMEKIEIFGIPYFKKGSEIHIKDKNKGKFTASAKAHGMGV
jgi:hypothetical protein